MKAHPPAQWNHVVWIVIENRGAATVRDPNQAPYLASLAARCGVADNMRAITHPSFPNYIALTAGSTLGAVGSPSPAQASFAAPSIFSQVGPSGWRVYNQSMPSNCLRTNSGPYAVRHNPAAYYLNVADACAKRDVPINGPIKLSARFTMIIPDLNHGMHDGSVAEGDAYLSQLVPQLLATKQYRAGKTAIFITADEDEGTQGNRIATFVIAPTVTPGTINGRKFTHYSLLKTTEQMLGLPQLRKARMARSMSRGFNLLPR